MEPMSKMKILLCIGVDTVMFVSKESKIWKREKEYVEIEDFFKLLKKYLLIFLLILFNDNPNEKYWINISIQKYHLLEKTRSWRHSKATWSWRSWWSLARESCHTSHTSWRCSLHNSCSCSSQCVCQLIGTNGISLKWSTTSGSISITNHLYVICVSSCFPLHLQIFTFHYLLSPCLRPHRQNHLSCKQKVRGHLNRLSCSWSVVFLHGEQLEPIELQPR